ncbi:MAG: hypothetical protein ABL932_02885 [Terricaulis sp.]
MSIAQALAIAAAAWVTAVSADPSMTAMFRKTQAQLEVAASVQLQQIKGGFCATPDGVRIQRAAALR